METDRVLEDTKSSKVFEQIDENMVQYEILGLFSEDGSKYTKDTIPELFIRDSLGQEVSFKLTKEFTKELKRDLNHVERSYYGFIYVTETESPLRKLYKFWNRAKSNPIFYILVGTFILAVIGSKVNLF